MSRNTEDYATMTDDYKLVYDDYSNLFYSSREIQDGKITIKKDDLADPQKQTYMGKIRSGKSASDMIPDSTHTTQSNQQQSSLSASARCTNSTCSDGPPKKTVTFSFKFCPICNTERNMSCNCTYQDSMCPNGHKWYNDNGKMKLGSSHEKNKK